MLRSQYPAPKIDIARLHGDAGIKQQVVRYPAVIARVDVRPIASGYEIAGEALSKEGVFVGVLTKNNQHRRIFRHDGLEFPYSLRNRDLIAGDLSRSINAQHRGKRRVKSIDHRILGAKRHKHQTRP